MLAPMTKYITLVLTMTFTLPFAELALRGLSYCHEDLLPQGSPATPHIRRGKLNSQFIVTDFSILHAGGRSLFRFQTSTEYEKR
jgi:hypothetical protein